MQLIQQFLIMSLLLSVSACSTTSEVTEKKSENKKEKYSQNERFYGRFDR